MSPNQWGGGHIDFGADPIGIGTPQGGGHIDFGVDHVGIGVGIQASAWHFLVCTISCEPVVGFLPNFYGYIIGT